MSAVLGFTKNTRLVQRVAGIVVQQPAGIVAQQPVRLISGLSTKKNFGVHFVPQQEAYVIERFGKFHKILEPGINFLVPIMHQVKYIQSLKEITIAIPKQTAITADNVNLSIDGVLYLQIQDPYKASYGVENVQYAITQLAQTTMRSEIGKIDMDILFKEREHLNVAIVDVMNRAAEVWGVGCKRYEIRDIHLPERVREAMQMQVEAERRKRAAILESEGIREAEINVAEGKKQSRILSSEAYQLEQVNQATGEAQALIAKATAKGKAIETVAFSLNKRNGHNAVSISVAEQYIGAFSNLAKQSNTIMLPSNSGDVSSMVSQAMTIYKSLNRDPEPQSSPDGDVDPDDQTESTMETTALSTSQSHLDKALGMLESSIRSKKYSSSQKYMSSDSDLPNEDSHK